MSSNREAAIVARTKLSCAVRLLEETHRELRFALPSGHPLLEETFELISTANVVYAKLELTLKRIPK